MAQPQEPVALPRRSRGCLWSCLGVVLLFVVIAGGALLWGDWYIHSGFKRDSALQRAMTVVREDHQARAVLGDDIQVISVQSERFSGVVGAERTRTATYTVTLKGSKGQGRLHVTLHSDGGAMQLVSMVLTGPDGTRYNLTDDSITPSQNSI